MSEIGRERRRRAVPTTLAGVLVAILVAVVVGTIGRPLVGLGALHAADTVLTVDPWAQQTPDRYSVSNGMVSDTVDAIAPLRLQVAERGREGDLALWSSTQGGGAPALGVPNTAMLSPLNLPWWLAPGHAAPALAKALQMLVAAVGMVAFAHRLGRSRAAAVVAAVAFVNTGHLVVWTTWPQSNVAALVPALFWAVDRATQDTRAGSWWPVPLIGAAMWFEGFPALTFWAHVAAGAWVLVRLRQRRVSSGDVSLPGGPDRPAFLRRAVLVAGAMSAGLLVAAVQLVPFAFRVGELALGEGRAAKAAEALPAVSLGTTVFPRLLGSAGEGVWYGPRNEVELQAFLGMGVVALALIGWMAAPEPTRFGRWAAVAAAVLAGAIWLGPVNAVVQALPVVGGNQTGRLRGLLAFVVAVQAARGFDALRDRPPSRVLVRAGLLTAAGLLALTPLVLRARDLAADLGRDEFFRTRLVTSLVVLAVVVTLVAVVARARSSRATVAAGILVAVVAAEGVWVARGFLPRIDTEDFYPETVAHEVVRDLVGRDRFASGGFALYPGTTTRYGLPSLTAHAAMPPGWDALLLEADPTAYDASATFPILTASAEVAASRALDRLGVSHFVTEVDTPVFGDRDDPTTVGADIPIGAPVNGIEVSREALVLLDDHDLPASLLVRVTAEDGTVITARRRLDRRAADPWLGVPLPPGPDGANIRGGRVDVVVQLDPVLRDAPDRPEGLVVPVEDGTALRVVRVGPDGLRVVAVPDVTVYERPDAISRIRLDDASAGTIVVVRDDPDEIELTVDATVPTTVVVADARSGSHRATVDGAAVATDVLDEPFVTVAVPAGTSTVRIRIVPEGFRTGAALSVLGLLATWLALWRRHVRPGH